MRLIKVELKEMALSLLATIAVELNSLTHRMFFKISFIKVYTTCDKERMMATHVPNPIGFIIHEKKGY